MKEFLDIHNDESKIILTPPPLITCTSNLPPPSPHTHRHHISLQSNQHHTHLAVDKTKHKMEQNTHLEKHVFKTKPYCKKTY